MFDDGVCPALTSHTLLQLKEQFEQTFIFFLPPWLVISWVLISASMKHLKLHSPHFCSTNFFFYEMKMFSKVKNQNITVTFFSSFSSSNPLSSNFLLADKLSRIVPDPLVFHKSSTGLFSRICVFKSSFGKAAVFSPDI